MIRMEEMSVRLGIYCDFTGCEDVAMSYPEPQLGSKAQWIRDHPIVGWILGILILVLIGAAIGLNEMRHVRTANGSFNRLWFLKAIAVVIIALVATWRAHRQSRKH